MFDTYTCSAQSIAVINMNKNKMYIVLLGKPKFSTRKPPTVGPVKAPRYTDDAYRPGKSIKIQIKIQSRLKVPIKGVRHDMK